MSESANITENINPESNNQENGGLLSLGGIALAIACCGILFAFVISMLPPRGKTDLLPEDVSAAAYSINEYANLVRDKTVRHYQNGDDFTSMVDLNLGTITQMHHRDPLTYLRIYDGFPYENKKELTLINGKGEKLSRVRVIFEDGDYVVHFLDLPKAMCGKSKIATCDKQ